MFGIKLNVNESLVFNETTTKQFHWVVRIERNLGQRPLNNP